jgi:LCP family protein required for cell wall assembly
MSLPKKRKKNRSRRIALTLLAVMVVVVGVIFAAAYFTVTQRNREQSVSSISESSLAQQDDVLGSDEILYQDQKYVYNDHLSNFLFMGVDNRETSGTEVGKTDAGQADAIFLLSWDRVEKSVKIIGIPRDTMTEIETFGPSGNSLGKSVNHINLAYGFGDGKNKSCELERDAVSSLFYGIPIQGYCSINLDGLSVLTEVIEGVTVTVPDDSLEEAYPEFQEGAQVVLTPDNVEAFVRYRDTTKSFSALVRQQRQNVFIKAFAEKATEAFEQDASVVTQLYTKLDTYMVTSMGNDIFVKIAQDVASGGARESMTVPGEAVAGEHYDEYHVNDEEFYEMVVENFYKAVE